MKLIVGLGNPGLDYQNTRHNMGYMALDFYARKHNLEFQAKKRFKGDIAIEVVNGEKIIFLKPTTFMNLSGESIILVKNFYKIDQNDILIIYDDMDLDVGKIRLRTHGSSAGHNGIKDIIRVLGNDLFKRIRIGISKPIGSSIDFVLGHMPKEEMDKILDVDNIVSTIIEEYSSGKSFDYLMNQYN